MIKIYYEIEELDDTTIQIGCREEDKEEYLNEIKHGYKRETYVNVKEVMAFIDHLRKSNDMWRYPEDELWSKFEDMITNQSNLLQVENGD